MISLQLYTVHILRHLSLVTSSRRRQLHTRTLQVLCTISTFMRGSVVPDTDQDFYGAADMCSSGVTGGTLCPLQSGSTYAICPYLASGLACTASGELFLRS